MVIWMVLLVWQLRIMSFMNTGMYPDLQLCILLSCKKKKKVIVNVIVNVLESITTYI